MSDSSCLSVEHRVSTAGTRRSQASVRTESLSNLEELWTVDPRVQHVQSLRPARPCVSREPMDPPPATAARTQGTIREVASLNRSALRPPQTRPCISRWIGNESRYVRVAPFAMVRPTLVSGRIQSLSGRCRLQVSSPFPARLHHGRVGLMLLSSPSACGTARKLPAGAKMVSRRHLEPVIVRTLKNIEFGLMTGPAICVPGLPNKGYLPCYYNALWN